MSKILLKNGLVYDGTSNPPEKKDILIEDNKIIKIESVIKNANYTVIDCNGLAIAPGFIDAHSHNDFFVYRDNNGIGFYRPFIEQGIATQIVGNCGFSVYGMNEQKNMEYMSGSLFKSKKFPRLSQYVKDTQGKLLVNLVPLLGHGTIRAMASGYKVGSLSDVEFKSMMDSVEQGLKDGAFGGSLGLMYEPGMYAPREELVEFAKLIAKYDGILTCHPRANSAVAMGYPLLFTKPHVELGMEECIDIVKKSNVRFEYSHMIFVGKSSWKCVNPLLKLVKDANSAGQEIGFDIYPYTYGASIITVVMPPFYMALSKEEKAKKINQLKLKLVINVTKRLLGIDFSDMVVADVGNEYPQYRGKTVTECAAIDNLSPFDMYLKLVDISNGNGRMMLGKYYNEEIIKQLMNDELSIFMTDAWFEEEGYQNGGTYSAFPYFFEKARKYGIAYEKVINKMTGKTADRYQIDNLGYIKPNYDATFTIFNPSTIARGKTDVSKPIGIEYVIINGKVVVEKGICNDSLAGKVFLKTNTQK